VKGLLVPDPYDVLTIAAMTDELNMTIGNGRIQRIGLVDSRTIGAEIYGGGRRRYLLASADDRNPRLRLAADMPSLDPSLVTPFGLLLRKHLRGGVILGIDQPPLERLVRFSIAKRSVPLKTGAHGSDGSDDDYDDDGDDEQPFPEDVALRHRYLYVELMGRHSNLILVDDDGFIMESAKRVTPAMSRARPVLPRLPYVPPPTPERRDPRRVAATEVAELLETLPANGDVARALVNGYRGISPVMAREIVFRVAGASEVHAGELRTDAAAPLAQEVRTLLGSMQTTRWDPRVYREGNADGPRVGDVVAATPLPMAHLAAEYDESAVPSMSDALALAETGSSRLSAGRHVQRRQRLLDVIMNVREKAERRLASLAHELARAGEAERLKTWGDLIYANLWQIGPGQSELVVEEATIPLDPKLSASENAQAYFEQYRKARDAAANLPALEAETRTEISYLDQLATLVSQAPGFAELEALAAEWAEQIAPEPTARARRKNAPRRPKALVDQTGNSVYVGRSGLQNDLVTFDIAGPDDTWLHARGVGGSHVVIRWQAPGAEDTDETIAAAAALAAWYSAARESGAVEVDVAKRRHVRKIKGGRPGMVTYRNERTIRVQPAPEERLRGTLTER
jgi:predicted ribosome quality control (RQC) complex YloA/Tae2 family protein